MKFKHNAAAKRPKKVHYDPGHATLPEKSFALPFFFAQTPPFHLHLSPFLLLREKDFIFGEPTSQWSLQKAVTKAILGLDAHNFQFKEI